MYLRSQNLFIFNWKFVLFDQYLPSFQTPALTTIVLLWFWVQLFKNSRISEIAHYFLSCIWFVSLSKVFHVVQKPGLLLLLWLNMLYTPRFYPFTIDGYLGCSISLAITNIAAMNMEIRISLLYVFYYSLKIYAQKWNCWVIW